MPTIGEYNGKIFNPQVFEKYMDRVPNLKQNELIKSGVYDVKNKYRALMTNQDGGDYIVTPIKGLLDGEVQNYDGVESMEPTSTKTFYQGKPVFGRMKAWQEKDFATELTGVNWIKDIAGEVAEYYQAVDQDDLLAILDGVFKMSTTDKGNKDFVDNHVSDISGDDDGLMTSASANTALQKALGANKSIVSMAIMHSQVATNLANIQLLTYWLYNDANGIQRQMNLASWNGLTVIIDDSMPVSEDGKYTTYLLGRNAIEFEDVGVKVRSETGRDAAKNGGIDILYTRQRHLVAPKWISYTKKEQATSSATKEELANGDNWELVNDGNASSKTYVNHKAIPIVKIVSKG